MAFNQKLNRKIVESGMTQSELAKIAKIAPASLSSILNGHTKPHTSTQYQIADALQCDVSEIFDNGGEK